MKVPGAARATRDPPALLAAVPLGGLLLRLLRLLVAADRREEFLGDLVEEGNLRRCSASRSELALWLWRETLRSAPTLVAWRIRRLAARPDRLSSLPAGSAVLVGSSRAGHRGWPLSLAFSLSAHALVLCAAAGWVISQVDEIEPPRFLDFSAAFVPEQPARENEEGVAPTQTGRVASPGLTQARPSPRRRRPVAPAPVLTPAPPAAVSPAGPAEPTAPLAAGMAAGSPAPARPEPVSREAGPGVGEPRLRLPPRIAMGEKRCLSCPFPQLPHPYVRLGLGREMLVKTCVNTRGSVSSVQVLSGLDPAIDNRVTETIRRWRLVPYWLNGHAVPFCYETRFLFTTH